MAQLVDMAPEQAHQSAVVGMVADFSVHLKLNTLDKTLGGVAPYAEPQVLIDARESILSGCLAANKVSPNQLDALEAIGPSEFPNPPPSKYGHLPTTIANVQYMLGKYGIRVRYNTIKKKLMIRLLGRTGLADNADNTAMTTILSLAALNGMATVPVPPIVEVLGDRNPYNPVAVWILKTPWDGIDRLPDVYGTLTAREGFPEQLKKILVYKWLLSAVAAALKQDGFKGRGVLVFQGPQGIGKTSWVVSLVPDSKLRELVVKVDHHLDANNKDSILGAITHWIVEIGELDSSFRKDFARLKGYLTSDSDKVRRPYARTESEYQRRTVFFATVNDENFLVDHTGNTRWWTIPLVAINFEHGIDMQQVFAQLAVDWANGGQWWLTKEEEALLESCNSDHRTSSVIRDLVMDLIDLDKKDAPGNPYKSTTELFGMLDIKNPKNGDSKELTGILRELLGASKKVNGTQRWRIPLRKPETDFPDL
jgi:putative DNA primase/helicase